jgi:predicted AAA+ superfamily ATPase
MVNRIQKLSKNSSLFLFGARGTGKSTLLSALFGSRKDVLWIDLLKDEDEELYRRSPAHLTTMLDSKTFKIVVIDEVQKNLKLLDIVHLEIEKKRGVQFVLSGSSARKLKRGGANLLAGRAVTFHLFPLTTQELGSSFDLGRVLEFGSLPSLLEISDDQEKRRYLKSYVKTYLREEIQLEQLVRKLAPFQDFLEIAAQTNGKIINFSKIGKDIGVDDKTIKSYFQILEDTLVGFYLQPFHRSIRKRQRESPKFYLFDIGAKRALDNTINVPLSPKTYAYGDAFEHFVILEIFRLNSYLEYDFKLSYLRTKDDAELDLIIERPGLPDLLVEIKSYDHALPEDARKVKAFLDDWDRNAEGYLISKDTRDMPIHGISCLFWQTALKKIFGGIKLD